MGSLAQAFAPTMIQSAYLQTPIASKSTVTLHLDHRTLPARYRKRCQKLRCEARPERDGNTAVKERKERSFGLGDLLGPIGLTIGGSLDRKVSCCALRIESSEVLLHTILSFPVEKLLLTAKADLHGSLLHAGG